MINGTVVQAYDYSTGATFRWWYKADGTLQRTFLLAGLADGESFVDTVNGITITQVNHNDTRSTAKIDFVSTCVQSTPLVSVSPQAQSAAPGGIVNYIVSLTNRDTSGCAASALSLSDAVPAGWTTGISPVSLTLSAGATAQVTVTVQSASTASAGTYNASININRGAGTSSVTSAIATYTVQPPTDTTAPSAPTHFTASANQHLKQIELAWRAAADNVGVVGYRVARNGAIVATTTTTSWNDQTWPSGTTYTYFVVAFDAAGNTSPPSNTSTVTVPGGGGGRR